MTMTLELERALSVIDRSVKALREFKCPAHAAELSEARAIVSMAYLTQPAQSVDVADVRLLLECVAEDHGGDHFEATCPHCAAVDRLTAALQEKGNG